MLSRINTAHKNSHHAVFSTSNAKKTGQVVDRDDAHGQRMAPTDKSRAASRARWQLKNGARRDGRADEAARCLTRRRRDPSRVAASTTAMSSRDQLFEPRSRPRQGCSSDGSRRRTHYYTQTHARPPVRPLSTANPTRRARASSVNSGHRPLSCCRRCCCHRCREQSRRIRRQVERSLVAGNERALDSRKAERGLARLPATNALIIKRSNERAR